MSKSGRAEERRLKHDQTIADYVALREEWTGFRNTTMVLFSIAIAVHGVVVSVLANISDLKHGPIIAAAAPLVPWLVLGQYVQSGVDATLRGFYGRAVERSLIAGRPGELPLTLSEEEINKATKAEDEHGGRVLPAPLLFHLTHPLGSPKRQLRPLQAQTALGMIVLAALTAGETVLFLLATESVLLSSVAGLVYLAFAIIDVKVLMLALRGERLWAYVIGELESGLRRSFDPIEMKSVVFDADRRPSLKGRYSAYRLLGFILLPRPFEFFQKGVLIFVGSFIFATAAEGEWPLGDEAKYVALSFALLELVVYQGRYLLNDINGRRLDEIDPARSGSRIPDVIPQWLAVALLAVRGIGAAALVWYLISRDAGMVQGQFVALLIVVGGAAIYEIVRRRCDQGNVRYTRTVTGILGCLIGTGYGARGVYGLSTAYAALWVDPPPGSITLGGAYMMVIGFGGVLCAWLLSATGYRHRRGATTTLGLDEIEKRPYVAVFLGLLPVEAQGKPTATALRIAGHPRSIVAGICGLATGLAAWCGHAMASEEGLHVLASVTFIGLASAYGIARSRRWLVGCSLILLASVLAGLATGGVGSPLPALVALMPWSTFWSLQQMSATSMYALGHRLDWAVVDAKVAGPTAGQLKQPD